MTRALARRRPALVMLALVLVASMAACGSSDETAREPSAPRASESPPPTPSVTPSRSPTRTLPDPPPSDRPVIGVKPPPWLGQRVLPRQANGFGEIRPTPPELDPRRFTLPDRLPPLPGAGFASRVTTPPPAAVLRRSTWSAQCPVAPGDLSWIRLTFVGFDGRRHTGELLAHRSVAADLVTVFRRLYAARFPLEEMRITRKPELDAPPTGDGNNTGAFVCRATTGGSSYSQHAYGLAVDVNPFQNPYLKDDLVLPELASSYLQRRRVRPGMFGPGGAVVRAFASIGWEWGGDWRTLKDYQHFSQNGT